MPNIKPISDLRNYGEVLRDVSIGSPVLLTKNGHGRYAVLDIEEYREYEKILAWRKLKLELDKGRDSGEDDRWVSAQEARTHLEERCCGKNNYREEMLDLREKLLSAEANRISGAKTYSIEEVSERLRELIDGSL